MGIAVSRDGILYVADRANCVIRKIDATNKVTTYSGSNTDPSLTDGPRTVARFSSPTGIAIDSSGTIFVTDLQHNAIRKISTSAGIVTTIAGGTYGIVDGFGTNAAFQNPNSLAVATNGKIYVTESSYIRVVNTAGTSCRLSL
jgi:sugar lactone lactonase YvrE